MNTIYYWLLKKMDMEQRIWFLLIMIFGGMTMAILYILLVISSLRPFYN